MRMRLQTVDLHTHEQPDLERPKNGHVQLGMSVLCIVQRLSLLRREKYTVEPPNNGHVGDECFVHCLEVVPSCLGPLFLVWTGSTVYCHTVLGTYHSLVVSLQHL